MLKRPNDLYAATANVPKALGTASAGTFRRWLKFFALWDHVHSNIFPRAVRVVTAAGAVTVAATDDVVVVNKTSGAATVVNLPAGVTGTVFRIKDGKGDAATNNITLTPAAGNIDGAATSVISTNYGSRVVVYNGTQWNVL